MNWILLYVNSNNANCLLKVTWEKNVHNFRWNSRPMQHETTTQYFCRLDYSENVSNLPELITNGPCLYVPSCAISQVWPGAFCCCEPHLAHVACASSVLSHRIKHMFYEPGPPNQCLVATLSVTPAQSTCTFYAHNVVIKISHSRRHCCSESSSLPFFPFIRHKNLVDGSQKPFLNPISPPYVLVNLFFSLYLSARIKFPIWNHSIPLGNDPTQYNILGWMEVEMEEKHFKKAFPGPRLRMCGVFRSTIRILCQWCHQPAVMPCG